MICFYIFSETTITFCFKHFVSFQKLITKIKTGIIVELIFWVLLTQGTINICDCNRTRSHNHLTVCSYHVTYTFQSESTLYICLNVKELLAQNRCDIRSLSDCIETRTHNHLVHKQTLNHLVNLAKWLSVRLRTK